MDNGIRMNQDEFQNAFKAFEQVINKLDQTTQGITSSFSPAVSSGLITNLDKLSNQMGSLGSSISGMNQALQKQSNEMFSFDSALAKEADAIEIPTDFLNENSTKVNNFNQAILNKIDGKSVNLGQGAKPTEIDEAVVLETQTKEGLVNLSGATTKEEEYNKKQGVQAGLGDITRQSDLTEKDYKQKSGTKEGNLQDITGIQNLDDKKYVESTVARKEMANISKESDGSKKELDEAVNIRGQQMKQMKDTDGNVNANIGMPNMQRSGFANLQSGSSQAPSSGLASNFEKAEQKEKENMLSQMMLEEERKRQLAKKQVEEDKLEKVDYSDFSN